MNGSEMNKRAVENLIRSGAFDSMGARRSQLIKVYETVMDSVAAQQRAERGGTDGFLLHGRRFSATASACKGDSACRISRSIPRRN